MDQSQSGDIRSDTYAQMARLIAYYLPQFHPIDQNDEWWGKGFTEWTNVAKARPLYSNHIQPQLPGELGFYDLRLPETREAQARMAREHGIEGFCYWHYWFGDGVRILERPFEEVLSSGKPDFPFCLSWANMSWTGVWHGSPKTVLLKQTYPGYEDSVNHFNLTLRAFRDPRYMCVDGKPIFSVLAPSLLPDAADFVSSWRKLAEEAGLPGLYMVGMSNNLDDPSLLPFDAATPYGPGDYLERLPRNLVTRIVNRIRNRDFGQQRFKFLSDKLKLPERHKYSDVVDGAMGRLPNDGRCLPCVLPNWDNTPRSGSRGVVFTGSTPELFGKWLGEAVRRVSTRPQQERIVFLKAWNEWAEGNYLEPDITNGRAFLEVIRSELEHPDRLGATPPLS